jgi:hypothetical protein
MFPRKLSSHYGIDFLLVTFVFHLFWIRTQIGSGMHSGYGSVNAIGCGNCSCGSGSITLPIDIDSNSKTQLTLTNLLIPDAIQAYRQG